jgi:hypothetical protein
LGFFWFLPQISGFLYIIGIFRNCYWIIRVFINILSNVEYIYEGNIPCFWEKIQHFHIRSGWTRAFLSAQNEHSQLFNDGIGTPLPIIKWTLRGNNRR